MSKGSWGREAICLPMDTTDMEKTVMQEMTPMVATSYGCRTSISGLMITPPPIPVMDPAVVAPIAIRKYRIYCMKSSFPS